MARKKGTSAKNGRVACLNDKGMGFQASIKIHKPAGNDIDFFRHLQKLTVSPATAFL
jgi:hypothetical protein